jgi:hypothetical protein
MSLRLNKPSHSGLISLWPRLFGIAPFSLLLILIFLLGLGHQAAFAAGSEWQTVVTGQVKIQVDKPTSNPRGTQVKEGGSGAISYTSKKFGAESSLPS